MGRREKLLGSVSPTVGARRQRLAEQKKKVKEEKKGRNWKKEWADGLGSFRMWSGADWKVRAEDEAESRAKVASFAWICGCPWSTGTTLAGDYLGKSKPKHICSECGQNPGFRLNESSESTKRIQTKIEQERHRVHTRSFNNGEWRRRDGKAFLKFTPLKPPP